MLKGVEGRLVGAHYSGTQETEASNQRVAGDSLRMCHGVEIPRDAERMAEVFKSRQGLGETPESFVPLPVILSLRGSFGKGATIARAFGAVGSLLSWFFRPQDRKEAFCLGLWFWSLVMPARPARKRREYRQQVALSACTTLQAVLLKTPSGSISVALRST